MNKSVKNRQLGATLPLVVFALTALLGMAALAIDIAMMTFAKQRAQNVADAARAGWGGECRRGKPGRRRPPVKSLRPTMPAARPSEA